MRKFVRTAAVLALALALLSTSAFAQLTGGSIIPNADGTYSANIQGADSEEQITLLAVEESAVTVVGDVATLGEFSVNEILYLDQKAADGTTDSFANFSLMGDNAGKKVYFFAGSTSSTDAVYIGEDAIPEPFKVVIDDDSIEVGKELVITAQISSAEYEDSIEWSITSSNAANARINGDSLSANFTADVEGVYTVRATLSNNAYDEATITVTPKNVMIDAPSVFTVEALADEEGSTADNQNGFGVALEFSNLPSGFTRMIYVFSDGSTGDKARVYSEAVDIDPYTEGSLTVRAAFGNGTANGTIERYAVQSVDAILWNDVEQTEYFTNEIDKGNKKPADAPVEE